MNIIISPPIDIEKLSLFLEEMNKKPESHIGYCGKANDEIAHTLLHEFSDIDISQCFAVAYENKEIIGALGLDIDMESKSAEVWGPYIKNESEYLQLADMLWEKVNGLSNIVVNEFSFFVNKENTFAQQFAINKQAVYKGNHQLLKAFRNDLGEVDLEQIVSYDLHYKDSFSSLHEATFPKTYYSSSQILQRLNKHNRLIVMTDNEERIKGYVYVEASPEHKEGAIEYITISPDYRKQGIGTKLIRAALSYLFSYKEIEEISLSVEIENHQAIRLYKSAGFKLEHELVYYLKRE
ncbi:N-acetyltransferase [Psychrobacillus sp. OK032]|uniref:GNAT family N-acetyltransferase n=1 Tax=Psychrobacillus sp. OK032 TaxID=1884358 RepID=UPI0008ADBF3E|nr:N-acetyltransferase [Psychrobacillus sp. OK032]SES10783.1 Acetyltransferase (GNAT) family protein [Psychrobacillus sp. OK032]